MSRVGWDRLVPGTVDGEFVRLEVVEEEGTQQLHHQQHRQGQPGVGDGEGGEEVEGGGGADEGPGDAEVREERSGAGEEEEDED